LGTKTVQVLKQELRQLGLRVSGKKADLVDRLRLHQQQRYESRVGQFNELMTTALVATEAQILEKRTLNLKSKKLVELRKILKEVGLRTSGNKALLIERILEKDPHSSFVDRGELSSIASLKISTDLQKGGILSSTNSPQSIAAVDAAKEASAVRLCASMSLAELRHSLKARGQGHLGGSKLSLARRLHEAWSSEASDESKEEEEVIEI
jgi:hypothetical protein